MITEQIKEISIYEAEKLQSMFLKEMQSGETFILDMRLVEKIDMVGIQLLLSLSKSLEEKEQRIEFINVSDAMLHEIKISHCDVALGLG